MKSNDTVPAINVLGNLQLGRIQNCHQGNKAVSCSYVCLQVESNEMVSSLLDCLFACLFIYLLNSAINYGGLSGSELEQKLRKMFKQAMKEERGHSPATTTTSQDTSTLPLGEGHSALLLELGFLSLENSFHDLARDCLQQVPKDIARSAPKTFLLRELLSAQLLVARQNDPAVMYTDASVETRVKALSHLEQLLLSAVRISDPDIIQVTCGITIDVHTISGIIFLEDFCLFL